MSDKKNAILFVFITGFNTLLNFIFAPYISRAFTVFENGTYGQVLLVSNLMVMIFSLGISNIYSILLIENKDEFNKVFSNSTFLLVIAGILGSIIQVIIGIFSQDIFNNNIYEYLLIFSVNTFFGILSSTLTLQLIYLGKTTGLLIITILLNLLKIILSVLAIQYFKSFSLFIFFLSLIAFLNYLCLFLLTPKPKRKFEKINIGYCKIILHESYPYLILSFLGYTILYVDGWMLSKLMSTNDYAIYRNGAIEIPFIANIYTSFSAVLLNKLSLLKQENKIREIFEIKKKTTQTIAIITFPIVIFLIFNADVLIPLYLSNKYSKSSIVFAIFSLVVLIRVNNYSDLLIINKNRFAIVMANAVVFVLSIVFNYIMIKKFGYIGAAISYVFSMFILVSILTRITIKKYNVSIHDYYNLKVLFYILLLSVTFVFLNKFLISFGTLVYVLTSILTLSIIYFIIVRYTNWVEYNYLPEKLKSAYFLFRKRKPNLHQENK